MPKHPHTHTVFPRGESGILTVLRLLTVRRMFRPSLLPKHFNTPIPSCQGEFYTFFIEKTVGFSGHTEAFLSYSYHIQKTGGTAKRSTPLSFCCSKSTTHPVLQCKDPSSWEYLSDKMAKMVADSQRWFPVLRKRQSGPPNEYYIPWPVPPTDHGVPVRPACKV